MTHDLKDLDEDQARSILEWLVELRQQSTNLEADYHLIHVQNSALLNEVSDLKKRNWERICQVDERDQKLRETTQKIDALEKEVKFLRTQLKAKIKRVK